MSFAKLLQSIEAFYVRSLVFPFCRGLSASYFAVMVGSVSVLLLSSCGNLAQTQGFNEPSYVFPGIGSAQARPDGTWLLEWEKVPGVTLTYEVYSREVAQGTENSGSSSSQLKNQSKFDFSKPSGQTTEGFFITENLLLKNNTCFVVRIKHSEYSDENVKELCTGHTSKAASISTSSYPPVFKSLTLINGAADGKLNAAEINLDQPVVALDALSYYLANYTVVAPKDVCNSATGFVVDVPKASAFSEFDQGKRKVCVKLFNGTSDAVYGESEVLAVSKSAPLLDSVEISDVLVNKSEQSSPLSVTISGAALSNYRVYCLANCTVISGETGVLSNGIPGTAVAQILVTGEGLFRVSAKLSDTFGNESSEVVATGESDFTPPLVVLGTPSLPLIPLSGLFSIPVTVTGSSAVNLQAANIAISGGTGCVATVINGSSTSPTVQLGSCSAAGNLSVSLAAGIAVDAAGNISNAVGPGMAVTVNNSTPIFNSLSLVNGASDGRLNALEATANQAVVLLDGSGFDTSSYAVVASTATCDGSQTYTAGIPLAGVSSFVDGFTAKVCVRLTNSLGVVIYGSSSNIMVDKNPPSLTTLSLINMNPGSKLNAASVSAGLPVVSYSLAAGESASYALADSAGLCNDSLTYTVSIPATNNPGFTNGSSKVVCIKVSDVAGNISFGASSSISTDTQAPLSPFVSVGVLSDGVVNAAENSASGFSVVINGEPNASFTLNCGSHCLVVSGGTLGAGGLSSSGVLNAAGNSTVWLRATSDGAISFNTVLSDSFGNVSAATSVSGNAVLSIPSTPTLTMSALSDGFVSSSENASPMNVNLSGSANASYVLTCTSNCQIKSGGSGYLSGSGLATPSVQVYADGAFEMSVTTTDSAGNSSSGTLSGTADLLAPVVMIGFPSQSVVTPAGSVSFPLTVSGASSVNMSQAHVTTTVTGGVSCTVDVLNGTSNSPSVTLSACNGSGTINITVAAGVASDAAGNSSAAVGPSSSVAVNNSAPVINSLSLSNAAADGKLNLAEVAANLSVVALDASGFDSATFAVVASTATCDASQTYTAGIPLAGASSFANGSAIKVCVRLVNSLGVVNYGASPVISTDKSVPSITISSPSVSTVSASDTVTFTLSFADTGGSGVSAVNLSPSDIVFVGSSVGCSATLAGSNLATRTLSISGCAAASGNVTFSVAAGKISDAAGNVSASSSVSPSFAVSNSAPQLTMTSPLNNAQKDAASFNLQGACASGLVVIITSSDIISNVATGTCSGLGTYSIPIQLSGADGSKNILVTEQDSVGQVSSVTRTFVKDTVAPVVSIGNASASVINATGSANYTISFSDSNGISAVNLSDVTLNTTGGATCNKSVTTNATSSATVTLSSCSGNGTVGFSIAAGVAQDAAGNTSLAPSASATFTVDNTAPAPTINSPAANSTFTTALVATALTGTCEAGFNVVLGGAGVVGQTTTCPSGMFSFASWNLSAGDGAKSFSVSQTDAVGNSGTSATVTVALSSVAKISRSLRFRSSGNTHLSQTTSRSPAADTSFTISFWMKLSNLNSDQQLFEASPAAGYLAMSYFGATYGGKILVSNSTNGADATSAKSDGVLRDPAAWYHIAYSRPHNGDGTLYVNGVAQSTRSTSTANIDLFADPARKIGRRSGTADRYGDFYLADFYVIDGQSLTPSSFTTVDGNGLLQPKAYLGSYGAMGFHLDFSDNSSTTSSTLGKDTSGNGNHWTPNGFQLSEGGLKYSGFPADAALDGTAVSVFKEVNFNPGGTLNFSAPIPYNTLEIHYGNMANGQLGNPASGAVLSVNGTNVTAQTVGSSPYNSSYTKIYSTSTPGTLSSLSISAGISGSHESRLHKVIINGSPLYATHTNAGRIYSSELSFSGSGSVINPQYAFDTDISTFPSGPSQNPSQIRWNLATPITGFSKIEVWASIDTDGWADRRFKVNSTTFGGGGLTQGWFDVTAAAGSALTYMEWGNYGGADGGRSPGCVSAIRVDGVILTDGIPPGIFVGSDSVVDTPSSYGTDTGAGGEVRGNYATLNPLKKGSHITSVRSGNLEFESTGSSQYGQIHGTIGVSSGRWYWEGKMLSGGGIAFGMGLADANSLTSEPGGDASTWVYLSSGYKYNSTVLTAFGSSSGVGDTIGIAFDADSGALSFYKNGTSMGTAFTLATGRTYVPVTGDPNSSTNTSGVVNFGQTPFKYPAPAGYKALVDTNLPAPAIAKPNTVFDAITYTGNGSNQSIVLPGGFSPDLVWIKNRTNTGSSHTIFDSIRGINKRLASDLAVAEDTQSGVTSFNANGFSIGSFTSVNTSSYVAWVWNAGTTAVTNTLGSITSTLRSNTDAGISLVGYTYSASNGTVGHGLGKAPDLILEKSRDQNYNWLVYHKDLGPTKVMRMSQAAAASTESEPWNNTAPTASVFSVGPSSWNGGNNVAYCFVSVPGFSKIGSFTGNSSTDGPFIYTGFKPKFILMKRVDSAEPWVIRDTARDRYNGISYELYANTDGAEPAAYTSPAIVDYLSNGFKLRSATASASNAGTIIYAAFAENPFQYSRGR